MYSQRPGGLEDHFSSYLVAYCLSDGTIIILRDDVRFNLYDIYSESK